MFPLFRTKHMNKDDDVYSYIPSQRKVRRMTGVDLTESLMDSDVCPDDFYSWRQKINPKMTFRMSETKLLLPACSTEPLSEHKKNYDFRKHKYCHNVEWEIRPLYVLEIDLNDPDYHM